MKFGMPSLLECDGLMENVRLAQEIGLSFVEINCNVPEFQIEAMDAQKLKRITRETGIGFSLHLDEYMSITDPNPKISEAYIESVLESIEFAKAADIHRLTLHLIPGVVFTLPTQKIYVYEKYNDYYLGRLKIFRDKVESAIGSADLKLCIENTEGFKSYMRQGIELLLESPVFGLTYDCGHNARYGRVDEDFIHAHRNRIAHMHFHDVSGKNDHQPLFTADLDLKAELAFVAPTDPSVVVEVKSIEALKASIERLKTFLKDNPY